MTSKEKNPKWLGSWVDLLSMQLLTNAVYIAHETAQITKFNSRFPILRWILFSDQNKEWTRAYDKREMIYLYSDYYNINPRYKVHGILGVYDFKSDVFTDEGRERQGEVYTIRKGGSKPLNQHKEGSLFFDRMHNRTDFELKEIFNTRDRFISYDDVTMLSLFAALCGCESVVVPGPLSADEWRKKIPYLRYGIAYGDSRYERDRARETQSEIRPNLERIEKESDEQVDAMIAHVKEALC